MYHPWRTLRDHFPEWTLCWAPMVGRLGVTDYRARTITLDPDQGQAQRRSTLAHELQHVVRGPVGEALRLREESVVDQAAARQLIGIRELGEALAWAHNLTEAADELWVDEQLLQVRLDHLHPAERHYLRRRLQADDVVDGEASPEMEETA